MTVQKIRLDYTPRKWQRECHLRKQRFTVLAVHRRAGKTLMAVMELIDSALRCTLEHGLFAYIAPRLNQAREIAWAVLKSKLEPLRRTGAVEFRESNLSVTFAHNGAIVHLFGADNPDALRGVRLDGVVVDEVAQIKPELWNDVVQPALSDRKGWAIFIGTPAGINLFSELFYKATGQDGWHAARYTVDDTQALDADEVERLRNPAVMPEQSFAREYLCDFTASGDNQLISLADVETAAKRTHVERDIAHAPRILGVDPARFGDDRSVIMRRQGLQAFPALVYRGIDNMDLAARTAAVIAEWSPDAVFIDSGAGAGVIDRLRQLGHRVVEVPFGGKATQPHLFVNRRSEMWWAMRQWVQDGGAIPDDIALKMEMATPIYWFDTAGRKVLESKDDIKERLVDAGSPDIADALCLTFAAPVQPRPQGVAAMAKKGERFDPFKPWKR